MRRRQPSKGVRRALGGVGIPFYALQPAEVMMRWLLRLPVGEYARVDVCLAVEADSITCFTVLTTTLEGLPVLSSIFSRVIYRRS